MEETAGRGGYQVDTGKSGVEGILGRRSQRGSECGGGYVISLEVRQVPLLGARVTRMRAGDKRQRQGNSERRQTQRTESSRRKVV